MGKKKKVIVELKIDADTSETVSLICRKKGTSLTKMLKDSIYLYYTANKNVLNYKEPEKNKEEVSNES